MTTYLDEIIRHHRGRAAADGRRLADLLAQAGDAAAPRGMATALATAGAAGYDAVLVEQSFVHAGDLAAAGRAVADLVAAGR